MFCEKEKPDELKLSQKLYNFITKFREHCFITFVIKRFILHTRLFDMAQNIDKVELSWYL